MNVLRGGCLVLGGTCEAAGVSVREKDSSVRFPRKLRERSQSRLYLSQLYLSEIE